MGWMNKKTPNPATLALTVPQARLGPHCLIVNYLFHRDPAPPPPSSTHLATGDGQICQSVALFPISPVRCCQSSAILFFKVDKQTLLGAVMYKLHINIRWTAKHSLFFFYWIQFVSVDPNQRCGSGAAWQFHSSVAEGVHLFSFDKWASVRVWCVFRCIETYLGPWSRCQFNNPTPPPHHGDNCVPKCSQISCRMPYELRTDPLKQHRNAELLPFYAPLCIINDAQNGDPYISLYWEHS